MARFSADEFVRATGGVWWREKAPAGTCGVYTDSREEGKGRVFIALSGERFDAHDFAASAVEKGAGALLVAAEKVGALPPEVFTLPVLVTPDPLRAYQALARHHRRRFPGLAVAAVTGSVGKTSVKEMLRSIFAAEAGEDAVLHTVGNTNNQVGVAQNLLRLEARHRYAVIEMGTNHHGEIEPLSRMAEPAAALVNTVAPCHLEHLGDLAGVAREKARIYAGLRPGGIALYPAGAAGEEHLARACEGFRRIRFGRGGEVTGEMLSGDLAGSRVRLDFGPSGGSVEFDWALTGGHQAANAAGAAALARSMGIAVETIAAGLGGCTLPGMRMRIVEQDGVRWVNDAYNANPESMDALCRQLAAAPPSPLVLVLGDMLELGDGELRWHEETAATARRLLPAARLVLVGPRFSAACSGEEIYPDAAAAGKALRPSLRPGDTVVLKGSRGMRLEEVCDAL